MPTALNIFDTIFGQRVLGGAVSANLRLQIARWVCSNRICCCCVVYLSKVVFCYSLVSFSTLNSNMLMVRLQFLLFCVVVGVVACQENPHSVWALLRLRVDSPAIAGEETRGNVAVIHIASSYVIRKMGGVQNQFRSQIVGDDHHIPRLSSVLVVRMVRTTKAGLGYTFCVHNEV